MGRFQHPDHSRARFMSLFRPGGRSFGFEFARNRLLSSAGIYAFTDITDPSHRLTGLGGTNCSNAGNKDYVQFTGTQWYQSNRAATAFNWMHLGTGGTFIFVWSPQSDAATNAMYSTRGAAGVGVSHYRVTSGFVAYISTTGVVTGSAGAIALGTNTYTEISYLENRTPAEWVMRFKTATDSSGNNATPSAGDASQALVVGALDAAGTQPLTGNVYAFYGIDRVLTQPERLVAAAYIKYNFGIR